MDINEHEVNNVLLIMNAFIDKGGLFVPIKKLLNGIITVTNKFIENKPLCTNVMKVILHFSFRKYAGKEKHFCIHFRY